MPPGILGLADRLDEVAATVRRYIELDPRPWPESIASREKAREAEFSALPLEYPVAHTLLSPLHFLGSSQDHLTAMAAVVRAPFTVMGLLTLLRTQLVGAAYVVYLADQRIGLRERVRRGMNVYLDSLTEQMNLVGPGQHLDHLTARRRKVASGARRLGWTVTAPEAKAGSRPRPWWIGDRPPAEMTLLDRMLCDVADKNQVGHTLYRYLSGTSHAQPHALVGLIDPAQTQSRGDGSAMVQIALNGRLLTTFALVATGSLTLAVDRCVGLYGWPTRDWERTVMPILDGFRSALGVPQPPRGIQLLG